MLPGSLESHTHAASWSTHCSQLCRVGRGGMDCSQERGREQRQAALCNRQGLTGRKARPGQSATNCKPSCPSRHWHFPQGNAKPEWSDLPVVFLGLGFFFFFKKSEFLNSQALSFQMLANIFKNLNVQAKQKRRRETGRPQPLQPWETL